MDYIFSDNNYLFEEFNNKEMPFYRVLCDKVVNYVR